LEITVWPKGRRVWLKVQAGRRAPWIEEVIERVRDRVEAEFATLLPASSVAERTFGSVTPRQRPEDFRPLRQMFEEATAEEVMSETSVANEDEA
jgi:hypothetical protein